MPSKAQIKSQALQLRTIRFKYAAAVAIHARTMADAAKLLVEIDAKINKESIAVAGDDYEINHEPSFDTNKYMDSQLENRGEINGPGFVDILAYAKEVATDAAEVEAATEPPMLPFEEN